LFTKSAIVQSLLFSTKIAARYYRNGNVLGDLMEVEWLLKHPAIEKLHIDYTKPD